MKINPVYKKELKVSVRSVKLSFIILGYNLLLAVIGLFAFSVLFVWNASYRGINYSNILAIYTIIAILEFGMILFIVPAYTASAISAEREKQTLEILLTTKLKPIQIIMGKLFSSISTLLLLVFSSLPVIAIIFSIGGIQPQDILQWIFLIVITSIFIGSIGLFYSSVSKKTTVSTIFTYGTIIFLLLGTVTLVFAIYAFRNQQIDNIFAATGVRPNMNLAWLPFLLFINPAVSMYTMMTNQYGTDYILEELLSSVGNNSTFLLEHWFGISVVVQLTLSCLFLILAARGLNPLKERKRKIKSKKKKKKADIE